MKPLALVLIVKIVFTAIFVAIPDLVFPLSRLSPTFTAPGLLVLFRLYGIAILALLVGYGAALRDVLRDSFPRWLVLMGLISNAGAVIVVVVIGGRHAIDGGMFFFGAIALLLLISLIRPDLAMRTLAWKR